MNRVYKADSGISSDYFSYTTVVVSFSVVSVVYFTAVSTFSKTFSFFFSFLLELYRLSIKPIILSGKRLFVDMVKQVPSLY